MVHRRLSPWSSCLAGRARRSCAAALAAPISFTGYVTQDFNPATNPSVVVTPVSSNPANIGQQPWETANGWVSGWGIQDIRIQLRSHDRYALGRDQHVRQRQGSILRPFGQANGDPTGTPTSYDPANLGGDKSIALAFAPVSLTNPISPGTPVVVAGVPANKTVAGHGTDGFTVSTYNASQAATSGLGYSFGTTLPQYTGNLAYNPSSSHPQLEFTIKNFSKIPGLDRTSGFWLTAYAGSAIDGVGEAYLAATKIPALAEQNIPEPTTWMAWTLASVAAAYRFRRSSRRNRVQD